VRTFIVVSLALLVSLQAQNRAPADSEYRGWPAYGGGPGSIRYSRLDQINRQNVKQLEVAWTFDSGESGGLQTNPIVVSGILYAPTPAHHIVAINAANGKLVWRFDSGLQSRGPNRGVAYWTDGTESRIFAGVDQYLYALDGKTGEPVVSFGKSGRIDLRENLGRPPDEQSVRLTSPGVVYQDLLIIGGRVSESLPASAGDVRAYDVRTGALRWAFHTIPHPGELGADTWPKDAWTHSGGANNWAGMALDTSRGVVYVPTGSAAADFYGADRTGDNLFANSLLALDASTGRRIWHFQAVHHDIWDRDFPAPPSLVTVIRDGRALAAVAQTTKHGFVYLFDRTNGTPLFPIEQRPFPESSVVGERTSRTQPVPQRPLPFARQVLTENLLTTRTPEAHRAAVEAFRAFRSDGPFVPLSVGIDTVVFPGFDGGAEWGGSAFDPDTALLYVNANEMAWTGSLAPTPRDRTVEQSAAGAGNPEYRFTGYNKFLDPDGYPAIAPPWGTLSAINLNTGERAWQVPLGEYPELAAAGMKNTGSENYGGPVVTAGGLVFIGATSFDKKVRAFDKSTGELLWEASLPFSATGTPATYEIDGRQFLVVPAGGGKGRRGEPSGGVYVAFALPVAASQPGR
jgi:quinoprotein glucose dehydrogenase